MRRLGIALALAVPVLACSCAPASDGPEAPLAQEQVGGPTGVDITAARATALAFLSAYAESSTRGIAALRRVVAGADLRSWVRWLDVQNREFDGSVGEGVVDLRSASFASAVQLRSSILARVDVGASVTFPYSPSKGDDFELTRILDGPMTLEQAGTAVWRIVDVTRDGASMDAGITRFDRQTRRLAGVSVTLDSVFRFVPNWQFNIVVTNRTRTAIGLDPAAAALVVRGPEDPQIVQTVPSPSLRRIRPGGTVRAVVSVPFQDSDQGRVLSLPFLGSDRRPMRFVFPLGGLIDPTPDGGSGSAASAGV